MSRKSKAALAIERLGDISDCPKDLFDLIESSEDLFLSVSKAEAGDVESIKKMATATFNAYIGERRTNKAMLYYLNMACEMGLADCAGMVVICAARHNTLFDRLDDAIDLLKDSKDGTCSSIDVGNAVLKSILHGVDMQVNPEILLARLDEIDDSVRCPVELYILAERKARGGIYDAERVEAIAKRLGVPGIVSLSAFSGNEIKTDINIIREIEALIYALEIADNDNYRDFWLKCIYEYCNLYLNGDYIDFAEPIARALEARSYQKDGKLHLLAWRKYILEHPRLTEYDKAEAENKYSSLLDECRFAGVCTQDCDGHMESAIYASGSEIRKKSEEAHAHGSIIEHTRNRYTMCAEFTNHAKRGNRHMWETTISIDAKSGAPEFGVLKISELRHTVTRGGITLESAKKLTQVICLGKITVGAKPSPFEIDLILDISYVSATKCEFCEIKVRETLDDGEFITMKCQIYIY